MSDTIGRRLCDERKRLGLSQDGFAKAAGVSLSTQKRYETAERQPHSTYLEAIRQIGVDVNYVLFGAPKDSFTACPYLASRNLGDLIPLDMCRKYAATMWYIEGEKEGDVPPEFKICRECSKNPFKHGFTSASQDSGLDCARLQAVIEALETVLSTSGRGLSPAKKAQVLVLLYQASKDGGKVDPKMVEASVTLAAG